jgi:mannose-1-phosphate guanylyltransferase
VFPKLPSVSIDYGVMEKSNDIAVVPGEFGWSDVGSFEALAEVRDRDLHGNVASGDAFVIDCEGCVVLSSGKRVVSVVGAKDLVVVDTGDAVLVVPKLRSQEVRKVVDALKLKKRTTLL